MKARPIPEVCEFKSDPYIPYGPIILCPFAPRIAVSVAGLSELFVCESHGKEMRKKWAPHYDYTWKRI